MLNPKPSEEYVPAVIEGVGELARRHPDKRINFIRVGNVYSRRALPEQTFRGLSNVLVTALCDLVPIPRVLFTKVNMLTICGSVSEPSETPGVLGYDTEEQVYDAGTFSYVEALENVLLKKIYADKKYSLPKLRPTDEYYENFRTI